MELSDRELLDRYIASHDEAAFRWLVERYLPLVHGVTLRVTCNGELARDASQSTMIRLAERAALVPRQASLGAWLHRVSRDFAVDLVRREQRRKKREQLTDLYSSAMENHVTEPVWSTLAPVIDELVDKLSDEERDVITLRFYQNYSHNRVAAQLGLGSGEAARKKASRALEKLRALLAKRGIVTSAGALASALPAHALVPAPAGLSAAVLGMARGIVLLHASPLKLLTLGATTGQKALLCGAAALLVGGLSLTLRSLPQTVAPASTIAVSGRREAMVPATTAGGRTLRTGPGDRRGDVELKQEVIPGTSKDVIDGNGAMTPTGKDSSNKLAQSKLRYAEFTAGMAPYSAMASAGPILTCDKQQGPHVRDFIEDILAHHDLVGKDLFDVSIERAEVIGLNNLQEAIAALDQIDTTDLDDTDVAELARTKQLYGQQLKESAEAKPK